MKRVVLLIFVGGLASACASAQAKAPADRPDLDVPLPPPRTIVPPPRAEPATLEPVNELPAAPAPVTRPRPAASSAAPRTEPKPEPPPVVEQPPPTPPPPAPQLRTPGSADGPEAARQVRDLIERAQRALNAIDFQRLSAAQKGQYNNAKLMIAQAEEQVKGSNFDNARELAVKATRIATELPGR
jgi:hypothetical protein